jgi:hypothetical protein
MNQFSNQGCMTQLNNFKSKLDGTVGSWVVSALIFAIGATLSQANQITVVPGYGPWLAGAGGEFTVVADAGVASHLGAYSPFTMNQGGYAGSFQTFCVERNEGLAPNATYDAVFNNITVFSGDPLSAGAAYLYQQFATGQLNYNYANSPTFDGFPGGSRTDGLYAAIWLQDALWYLMNPNLYGGQANNPYVLQADAALGGVAAAFAPDNGAHGVSVLNLWAPGQPHTPAYAYQDVLVYGVPEPTTLAIFSVAGLLAWRRKK